MGKVVTIYLSDEETRQLKDFCDENQCTQYSALKTAVRQLLYRPLESIEEDDSLTYTETPHEETNNASHIDEEEEKTEPQTEQPDIIAKIRGLHKTEEQVQQEPETALTRLIQVLEKRRQEQEKNPF
jgi:hypothetical protein